MSYWIIEITLAIKLDAILMTLKLAPKKLSTLSFMTTKKSYYRSNLTIEFVITMLTFFENLK